MSKSEHLIIPKGTKFRRSGKLGLRGAGPYSTVSLVRKAFIPKDFYSEQLLIQSVIFPNLDHYSNDPLEYNEFWG